MQHKQQHSTNETPTTWINETSERHESSSFCTDTNKTVDPVVSYRSFQNDKDVLNGNNYKPAMKKERVQQILLIESENFV